MHANPKKVALVGAVLFGGWHLVWSVLVLSGFGQQLIDFVLWAHMIHLPYVVGPFDTTASVTLIVLTAFVGYIIGYSGAVVWNKIHN